MKYNVIDDKVYKCYLYVINDKIINDKIFETIFFSNFQYKCIGEVLIQKTKNKNYYKELITGRLIPVGKVINIDGLEKNPDEYVEANFKILFPSFVNSNYKIELSDDSIKDYLKKHNKKSMELLLDRAFITGLRNYGQIMKKEKERKLDKSFVKKIKI